MIASASDAAASLPVTAGIPISLFSWCVRAPFLGLIVFGPRIGNSIRFAVGLQHKAPATTSQGLLL
ncbi:hypothetical protein, partial [Pseudomonas sp. FW215-R2]|uniref:hypothetical protein n=1 Tax=Pseudomonas sp. FW215-R2 TaxID=2070615 RepID=UPI001C444A8A